MPASAFSIPFLSRPSSWAALNRLPQVLAILRLLGALLVATLVATAMTPVQAATVSNDEIAAETLLMVNLIRQRLPACREDGAIGRDDLDLTESRTAIRRRALVWNPRLAEIAHEQAATMAQQQFFSHLDTQGDSIGRRAADRGYRWRLIGENLASGHQSIAAVMRGWLRSYAHCKNLIDERFTEVGLARVDSTDRDDVYGSYWVMVLGRPAANQRPWAQPVLLAHSERAVANALIQALN